MTNPAAVGKKALCLCALLVGAAFPLFSGGPPGGAGEEVRLRLKVFPPGAALCVDGRPVEPERIQGAVSSYVLPRGARVLRLQAPGYHPKTVRVDLTGDFLLEERLERSDSRMLLLGETPTGRMPKSVAFSSDGKTIVIALLAERGVDLVPVEGLAPRRRLDLSPPESGDRGYVEAAPVRGRREIWVSQMDTGRVHFLREDGWEPLGSLDVQGRWSKVIALSADETLAFVSNWLSRDVSVVDVARRRLLRVVPVSGIPRGMAATADGRFLYVCLFDTGDIDKIDLTDFRVTKTLRLGPGAKRHIVLDEGRGRGYVGDMATGRVTCFSLEDDRVLSSLWAGSNLNTLVLSGDGRFLFASSRGRNNPESYTEKGPEFGKVSVIDTQSMTIVDWLWARNQPTGLALSPDGRLLAVTDFLDDNLELYDISALGDEEAVAMPRRQAGPPGP